MTTPARYEGIIVLGPPRSGTTLLRRLLDAHPHIACPGETNIFNACARFLHSESIAEGVEIGVLSGLEFAGIPKTTVLSRLREFACAFHREYAARQGKHRWAEKTAFDAFYLAQIEQIVGEHVYFICLQRHGLDVACSLQDLCNKNGMYLRELHQYVIRYPVILEAFAHAWVDLTETLRAFAQRHAENAILIRYEDLTADPHATMRQIMDFVGETWEPSMLDRGLKQKENIGLGDWKTYSKTAVDRTSVERWRELSRNTVSRLGDICNSTLIACGYNPVEIEGERRDDEARRRYELGLLLSSESRMADAKHAGGS